MRKRGIVRNVFAERLERWHLNVIRIGCIVRTVTAMAYGSADALKERVCTSDTFRHRHVRFRFRRVTVYLGGVENGVPASKEQTRTVRGLFAPIVLRFTGIVS